MPNTTPVDAYKCREVVNLQGKLIMVEEIFLDFGKQMLQIKYILNLGQLFKITFKLKKYLWQKSKPDKTHNVSKVTTLKQISFSIPEVGTIVVIIDNHMAIIQVQIGKNIIEYVLLDGGFDINIIT
jgi:hypothetical protein